MPAAVAESTAARMDKLKRDAVAKFWALARAEHDGKPADSRKLYDALTGSGLGSDDYARAVELIGRRHRHAAILAKRPEVARLLEGDTQSRLDELIRRRAAVVAECDAEIGKLSSERKRLEEYLGRCHEAERRLRIEDALPHVRARIEELSREQLALSTDLARREAEVARMQAEASANLNNYAGDERQAAEARQRTARAALPEQQAEVARDRERLDQMHAEITELESSLLAP
ncbi:MAG: hypothetical protein U0791_24280 [Gemmataceae bacterium]